MRETINITRGTDVLLNDRLLFRGSTFDPSLSVNVEAHLVSRAGVRTSLGVEVVDDYLVISVPWVTGRVAGLYGLEVRGVTNGLRWATYADSLIRYTNSTVQGDASDVTQTADAYDITQQVSYRYGESPISEVRVEVDDSIGTPGVSVSYLSRVLSLFFSGLKPNSLVSLVQTAAGASDGGVNTWTATLADGTVATLTVRNGSRGNGIASVERVAESSEDGGVSTWRVTESDGRATDISVRNGSRGNGIASVERVAESDADGGVNTWRVTESDGRVTDISVRNGSRGPQGASAVFDPDTGNILATLENTTGQSDSNAMTQKAVTDELLSDRIWAETEVSSQNSVSSDKMWIGTYNDAPAWKSDGTNNHSGAIFPVTPGKTYKLTASADTDYVQIAYAFVTAKSTGSNSAVSYATGCTKENLAKGGTVYLVAPIDAVFLYTSRKLSNKNTLPTVKVVELTKEYITALGGSITDIMAHNEKVDSVLSLLGFTTKEDVTPTWAGRGFVSIDQKIVSTDSAVFHYSNPITITEGQCIIVRTRAAGDIMVLTEDAEVNSGAKYNVLVKGASAPEESGVLTSYAYIAIRDMKVIISTYASSTCLVEVWSRKEYVSTKIWKRLYKPLPTYNILSAFDNLVAIGDSLTKGVVYVDSDNSRVAKRPYPKILQKLCGIDNLSIWAEGGKNAKYIWDTFNANFAVPSTGNTLCIVFLGTNGG